MCFLLRMSLVLSVSLNSCQKKNVWFPKLLDPHSHLKRGEALYCGVMTIYAFLLLNLLEFQMYDQLSHMSSSHDLLCMMVWMSVSWFVACGGEGWAENSIQLLCEKESSGAFWLSCEWEELWIFILQGLINPNVTPEGNSGASARCARSHILEFGK